MHLRLCLMLGNSKDVQGTLAFALRNSTQSLHHLRLRFISWHARMSGADSLRCSRMMAQTSSACVTMTWHVWCGAVQCMACSRERLSSQLMSDTCLRAAGQEQPAMADEARAAIFDRHELAFRCTLHSLAKDGSPKWTLFECWPNWVRAILETCIGGLLCMLQQCTRAILCPSKEQAKFIEGSTCMRCHSP